MDLLGGCHCSAKEILNHSALFWDNKKTFFSLVNHNLSLLSWCKPDLQSIDSAHGVSSYVNTGFIEVTKVVIQNRMVLDMLTAVQGGTCAIIKVECCVYIPDLSDNVSAALDVMKKPGKNNVK